MALSEKNRKLLTEIYAHFHEEGEIDEDPELALEYLLKGLVDKLAYRHVGTAMFESSLGSITHRLYGDRITAREQAARTAREAAEAAKGT